MLLIGHHKANHVRLITGEQEKMTGRMFTELENTEGSDSQQITSTSATRRDHRFISGDVFRDHQKESTAPVYSLQLELLLHWIFHVFP